ncbi:hypothetical protein C351_02299 [Cryptococcus neoformans c8]|nr:hypothetical protein C351_02299 [Cryptococcus neoformans var. grubii c8]
MVRLNIPTMLLLEEKMKETLRVTTRVATGIQGRTSKGRRMILSWPRRKRAQQETRVP